MRRLIAVLCLFSPVALIFGQQQESGMLERIQNPKMEASKMQDKAFSSGGGMQVKSFNTGAFTGSKSASTGEFKTKSFFGIRNPWFGRTVFETSSSTFANRPAREGTKAFDTSAFAVKANSAANRTSSLVDEELPNSVRPRETILPGKAQGSVDKFTQNLSDDLTVDEVRDLLNKGKQNR